MSPGDAPGNHQYCLALIAVRLPASAHPAAFMSLRADVTRWEDAASRLQKVQS